MAVRIVRLGTPRAPDEGVRLGTVRRPPRGVRKEDFARRDFYDLWLPVLSPSAGLVKQAQHATSEQQWRSFFRRFVAELNHGPGHEVLDLLAAFSQQASFSVGCYCEDERRCHRAELRRQLEARDAMIL